ncbi:hemicentin-1-like isoform X5 [Tigriopus californicus]|uniref:hemicentin-1-like isoform X5 n=1 Tax=Tigriopus californicus TaxID=6832 RepID=UPI0027D9DA03|nr:hemicentin-1-like isoform X5 [Tigriopus californicus]
MSTMLSWKFRTCLLAMSLFGAFGTSQLPVVYGASSPGSSVRDEVKATAGSEVTLACVVNQNKCGEFHSIKWYKENRRVFVYSPVADFAKAEGELTDRAELLVDEAGEEAKLRLNSIKTSDEGEYKCEITFLDVTKNCPVVQLVKLTTLAEPKYLNISMPETGDIVSSTSLGPFNEGEELRLLCESGGGKPIPKVTWYNGTEIMSGKASSFESPDGTGTGRNEIRVVLERGDLGSRFTCQSENEAIVNAPLQTSVQLDVNLRPESTSIIGANDPVQDGSVVTLMCRAQGARPAALITWYNGTVPLAEAPTEDVALQKPPVEVTVKQDDETYETQSRISFVASRFENGELITCEANNPVLEDNQEQPQRSSITLQILYAPFVEISPTNITVYESDEVTISCLVEANPPELKSVRWYQDGQLLSVNNQTKYEGGTSKEPSLTIKSVEKEDIGVYSCVVENEVGVGESDNISTVDVFYKPKVLLRMDPPSPVSETDRRNVTLFCDIEDGNPSELTSVRWYMNGELLQQLPICEDELNDENDLCGIDPSKLLLEHVTVKFHGNFSCEGANEAGWSDASPEEELEILYPPGEAFIRKDLEEVIKGDAITLTCEVSDLGRPESDEFIWKRGGHVVTHVTSFNWTIEPVTLETEANISCVAVNEVGEGEPDFIGIEVFAPPTFIERLPPYTGAMAESDNFSVECQVECSPLCDIFWLKDGIPIGEDDERFSINTTLVEADLAKNDFESVRSTLIWNIENWPGAKLDRVIDNANYTCQSTGNLVGNEGVISTTYFRVEYPPENIEISDAIIRLEEGSSREKVLCTAEAYPEANYIWKFNNENVAADNLLFFDGGISKDQAGIYTCVAQNKHGAAEIGTEIDVLYKPECQIEQNEDDGYIVLTCEALANPEEVTFGWHRVNATVLDEDVTSNGLISQVRLDPSPDNFGTYYCYVNNSIGAGQPCEIDVQGMGLIRMGNANLILIVAVVAALIVAVLIIIVCIILICRKKKKSPDEKYHGNKSSPDSGHPSDDTNPLSNGDGKGFYENLPFHGIQRPNKKREELQNQSSAKTFASYVNQSFPPPPPPLTSLDPPISSKEGEMGVDVGSSQHPNSSRPSSQLSQNGSSGYGSTRSQVCPFSNTNRAAHIAEGNNKSPSTSSEESVGEMGQKLATWGSMRVPALDSRSDNPTIVRASKQPQPQFASLRIPNRIRVQPSEGQLRVRPHDIPSRLEEEEEVEEDPGLDLIDAEVESDDGQDGPIPAPRGPRQRPCYMNMPNPLRSAHSVDEMQVYTAVPFNINNHQSLPRHFLREVSPVTHNGQMGVGTLSHLQNQLTNNFLRHNVGARAPGLPGNHPSNNILPTVSATLYDQLPSASSTSSSSANSSHHSQRPNPPTVSFKPSMPMHRHPMVGHLTMGRTSSPNGMMMASDPHHRSASHAGGPKQFDSYYYHPATLQRPAPCSSQVPKGLPSQTVTNRVVYADLNLHSGQDPRLEGRSTDYAVLKFNPNQQVGKEIDV